MQQINHLQFDRLLIFLPRLLEGCKTLINPFNTTMLKEDQTLFFSLFLTVHHHPSKSPQPCMTCLTLADCFPPAVWVCSPSRPCSPGTPCHPHAVNMIRHQPLAHRFLLAVYQSYSGREKRINRAADSFLDRTTPK